MITADAITRCAFLNSMDIETLLLRKKTNRVVLTTKFVGITNGGEFCYNYQYADSDNKVKYSVDKLFVRINEYNNIEPV